MSDSSIPDTELAEHLKQQGIEALAEMQRAMDQVEQDEAQTAAEKKAQFIADRSRPEPAPPADGVCPGCLKYRGQETRLWTLLPGYTGCKYCFVKFIPDKKTRLTWIKAQRNLMKSMPDAPLVPADRVPINTEILKQFSKLSTGQEEIKTMLLQLSAQVVALKQAYSVSENTLTDGVDISALFDLPAMNSHADIIKQNVAARLEISPESLSNTHRFMLGRPCCGYELREVFGDRFNQLFKSGASELVTSPRGFIMPAKLIRNWSNPTAAVIEKCRELVTDEDWLDMPAEYVSSWLPLEYIRILWAELNKPILTLTDYQRFGWPDDIASSAGPALESEQAADADIAAAADAAAAAAAAALESEPSPPVAE